MWQAISLVAKLNLSVLFPNLNKYSVLILFIITEYAPVSFPAARTSVSLKTKALTWYKFILPGIIYLNVRVYWKSSVKTIKNTLFFLWNNSFVNHTASYRKCWLLVEIAGKPKVLCWMYFLHSSHSHLLLCPKYNIIYKIQYKSI